MEFKIIKKEDVMGLLENEDLYLLRVRSRTNQKYCSSKMVVSLNVREVMDAIKDDNTAFILINENED